MVAVQRNHITESERVRISNIYEEIAKMLTGLIRTWKPRIASADGNSGCMKAPQLTTGGLD